MAKDADAFLEKKTQNRAFAIQFRAILLNFNILYDHAKPPNHVFF